MMKDAAVKHLQIFYYKKMNDGVMSLVVVFPK